MAEICQVFDANFRALSLGAGSTDTWPLPLLVVRRFLHSQVISSCVSSWGAGVDLVLIGRQHQTARMLLGWIMSMSALCKCQKTMTLAFLPVSEWVCCLMLDSSCLSCALKAVVCDNSSKMVESCLLMMMSWCSLASCNWWICWVFWRTWLSKQLDCL